MQNINDVEEYGGDHCSDQENGIDDHLLDDEQYKDLADQIGAGIVEVHRGTQH